MHVVLPQQEAADGERYGSDFAAHQDRGAFFGEKAMWEKLHNYVDCGYFMRYCVLVPDT